MITMLIVSIALDYTFKQVTKILSLFKVMKQNDLLTEDILMFYIV